MSIELSQEQIMSTRVEINIYNRLAISFRPSMSDFSHLQRHAAKGMNDEHILVSWDLQP